jgi:predicted RNA binding protein YcfA (HicA-like mRNA interferase family)
MPKLPVIKARELIRVLNQLGFFKYHQVGSHAQFKNAHGQRITIPVHSGKDIGKKTLKGILNDLNISAEQFARLLKK